MRLDVADVKRERVAQLVPDAHTLERVFGRHLAEALVDGVVDNGDFVCRDSEPPQDVGLRRFGNGEDAVGAVRGEPE